MSTADQPHFVSAEDYLQSELTADVKHEYLGGVVYAMSGGKNRHNLVSSNVLLSLGTRLRGRSCRAYNSDTKIRIRLPGHTRFYYPDASVICHPNPLDDLFQDHPVLVAEVLSGSTRRLDLGEKKDAYLQIPSLDYYLIVDPVRMSVTTHRRTEQGFVSEMGQDGQALALPTLGIEVALTDFFEGLG